jgi:hypothetical protein
MFEQQILCHKLPKSFDSIKAHNNEEEWANKRHKIIQDFKRRMLNIELGRLTRISPIRLSPNRTFANGESPLYFRQYILTTFANWRESILLSPAHV